jgi:hypothetical protein
MAIIHIESVQHAVSKGTLIALADDYRTSRTIRASLPRLSSYPFAISATAYSQEVQPGTTRDRQTRMEVIGAFLGKVLGLREKPTPSDLELRFPGEDKSSSCSLKLRWFAPNQHWVLLLPHEQLQPILKLA